MKKILCFAAALVLALSATVSASAGSLLATLYKDVKPKTTVSRAGILAETLESFLGEPEIVDGKPADLQIVIADREYIAIQVDADDTMLLVIGAGDTAYCWRKAPGLAQTIAKRAFTDTLPCYYSDEIGGMAYYTEYFKMGPSGSLKNFDEFLASIDQIEEIKAFKVIGNPETDQYFSLFSKVSFNDSADAVTAAYGDAEKEQQDDLVVLTYSDPALFRTLSPELEKYIMFMQFSFRNDQLEECCLIATGAAGNFMFCRSYLTEFYGEGWQTDGETIAEDPDKTVEGGDIYAWKTDDMRIWISEAAGAMTVIHYQRIR